MLPSFDAFRAQMAEMLELAPGDLSADAPLMDQGLDSMRAMNLAMQWEEEGVPLDFADLAEAQSLAELWALVEERQAS
nr:phosphopantetheine-binding protein [Croceibacterium ferulae]